MERDVTRMTEPELIEVVTTLPSAVEPIGELAREEYFKRRAGVIDAAIGGAS